MIRKKKQNKKLDIYFYQVIYTIQEKRVKIVTSQSTNQMLYKSKKNNSST